MAENAAGIAGAFLALAKIFVLAGLYDAARISSWASGPLIAVHLEARAVERVFGPGALRGAHDKRDALIRELGTAALHPVELIGSTAKNITHEYTSKWKRFEQVMGQSSLSANFEAGRIFGGVLVDVLMLISAIGDIAKATKLLSEIPELIRLSKSLKGFGRTAGGMLKDEGGAVRIGKALEESKAAEGASNIRTESFRAPNEPPPPVLRTWTSVRRAPATSRHHSRLMRTT